MMELGASEEHESSYRSSASAVPGARSTVELPCSRVRHRHGLLALIVLRGKEIQSSNCMYLSKGLLQHA